MKDDGLILTAWAEARERGAAGVLATVVKVSGSSYRSPGARMLLTDAGGRTGSISGGCLEGDVLRKAWWLTSSTPAAMRVYDNTSEEDAIWEFGLGCNGVVHVLLQRWEAGSQPLTVELLDACRRHRRAGLLATVISGEELGATMALYPDDTRRSEGMSSSLQSALLKDAADILEARESATRILPEAEVFFEVVQPPVPLLVVGAGHDALPVVRFAKELGWDVTVIDGRSNHARADRFPLADRVLVADLDRPLEALHIAEDTVAVLMSHSYEQDSTFFRALGSLPLRYLGVLGPRKRTDRMRGDAGLDGIPALHSPVGLDIGADTPEEIALAIVSEIQAALRNRDGGMLRHRAGPIHEGRRAASGASVSVPA